MDYLNFDLQINEIAGQPLDYEVAVIQSPGGEARATMHFPFDAAELQRQLERVETAIRPLETRKRKIKSKEEQIAQDFGTALFEALFTQDIRNRYDVSWHTAQQKGQGLRVRLRINSPKLAALPWEFLHDKRNSEYLCLNQLKPLIRYIELPTSPQAQSIELPLRILCMVGYADELDVEEEKQLIEKATEQLVQKGLIELDWVEGSGWRELQSKMRYGPWHIFHFIGHGDFDEQKDEGVLSFSDERGREKHIYATDLAMLIGQHPSLKLVVLNSCLGAQGGEIDLFSSTASILVRSGLPAVLAMQYSIYDDTAIELSRTFYGAIADGSPIDKALGETRAAIHIAITSTLEWVNPVLYMRSQDGVLFNMKNTQAKTKAPTTGTTNPGIGNAPTRNLSQSNSQLITNQTLPASNSIGEDTIKAVEEDAEDQSYFINNYVEWLVEHLSNLAPRYSEKATIPFDDVFMERLEQTLPLLQEFSKLSEMIARKNREKAAHMLYKGFSKITQKYSAGPEDFVSNGWSEIDFDLYKFIGHEFFVTFVAHLIKMERWELLTRVLKEHLEYHNFNTAKYETKTFTAISSDVRTIDELRNNRLYKGRRRVSLHSEIIRERHSGPNLSSVVTSAEFGEADYFLYVKSILRAGQDTWIPNGVLGNMVNPPQYFREAINIDYADQLAPALECQSAVTLRNQLIRRERDLNVTLLFAPGHVNNPLQRFDFAKIGTLG